MGGVYTATEKSYLRNNWNILDGFVVIIAVVGAFTTDKVQAFRVIRSMKALRTLRMASRYEGMRLIIQAVITVIPDVFYAVMICGVFMFAFALFCLSFFKGQFKSCHGKVFSEVINQNETYVSLLTHPIPWSEMNAVQRSWFGPKSPVHNYSVSSDCIAYAGGLKWPDAPCCLQVDPNGLVRDLTSRMLCECWGGYWGPDIPQKFDNAFQASISLFQISTQSNWAQVMYAAIDSTGIDMQPIRDNQPAWIIFFISFILICGFIAMNVFVGVVCDTFQRYIFICYVSIYFLCVYICVFYV